MMRDKIITPGCCETCVHEERDYYEFPCNECIRDTGNSDMYLPKSAEVPTIKDSGERRVFESGAVRDITEDKGRCDLLPLDVVADIMELSTLENIALFKESGEIRHLERILQASKLDGLFLMPRQCFLKSQNTLKKAQRNTANTIGRKVFLFIAILTLAFATI